MGGDKAWQGARILANGCTWGDGYINDSPPKAMLFQSGVILGALSSGPFQVNAALTDADAC